MRCTVYNKKRRTVVLATFLSFLAAAFFCAVHILELFEVGGYGPLLRLLGAVTLSLFLYVMMRHIALSFVYSITERDDGELDFTVARLRGKRARVMECVLSLSDLVFAVSGVTKRSVRKKLDGAIVRFYDYSVTAGMRDLVLIFADGDGYAAIIIEPSDEMRDYLTSAAREKF